MYVPNSKWTWSFVFVTTIQAACILAFESYVFARFQTQLKGDAENQTQSKTIPTFLTLYIFGFVYELVLVYDALRLKNTIQVIGLCVCNLGLLIYGAVQTDQIKDAVNTLSMLGNINGEVWGEMKPFLIAIPCIIGLGTVLMAFLAWKLYDEFAWTIYKHISADLRMKRRYLTYQIYIALLKFDFFFFLGFTVQFVVIVTDKATVEFALTLAAIPVTILILVMAAFWTRRENTPGMIVIILLYFGGLAYFLFKLVRMYSAAREKAYLPARRSLTFFAVITIILIIMTIINACVCTHNFNKGLKPHISGRRSVRDDEKGRGTEMHGRLSHGPVPTRMTID
ncbi:hypothetical protein CPC735_069680 [Coccidioides posadasii C735 delta SOWgp]|uniref:Uncharacterized protein n=2 Tax=Coccidioides posadasii TaxID=199306 RepID=A0A0J6FLW8_COCPO|nr:hypothetical protein CPC735_069680 [Coccidioides posadasii C735 delta SOWgp]EER29286.1 hypothetical protein CPC735_069680 [Coccidioides posadasii C735 delta SOWgp]KMM70420.1 hypothetical protein CPAG_06732 [Coccidioides posadasii RMSCC 3488]|eukprot:XP_003071431.1 hypothetical protein CPC735_069680 [Coccidioides posadasii C735 delta SOWgp]